MELLDVLTEVLLEHPDSDAYELADSVSERAGRRFNKSKINAHLYRHDRFVQDHGQPPRWRCTLDETPAGPLPAAGDAVTVQHVVFKAGRIANYKLQNLQLMAEPDGRSLESTYAHRWLPEQDRRLPVPGDRCLVVLSDMPHTEPVAVRVATFDQVEDDGEAVTLRLELGPFVAAGQAAALGTRVMQQLTEPHRPPASFVTPLDRNLDVPVATTPEERAAAWRDAVTQVHTRLPSVYEDVAFARLQDLQTEPGLVRVTVQLDPSLEGDVHARLSDAQLVLERDVSALRLSAEVPAGPFEADLRILAEHRLAPRLPVHVDVPAPIVDQPSPSPDVTDQVPELDTDDDSGDEASAAAARNDDGAVRLSAALARDVLADRSASLEPRLGRAIAEGLLARTTHPAVEDLTTVAAWWSETHPARAYELLRPVAANELDDRGRWLRVRTALHPDVQAIDDAVAVASTSLPRHQQFTELLAALRELSAANRVKAARGMLDVFGDTRLSALVQAVVDDVTDSDDLHKFASRVEQESPSEAFKLLRRRDDLALHDARLVEFVVDLADLLDADAQARPFLLVRLDQHVAAADPAAARQVWERLSRAHASPETLADAAERLIGAYGDHGDRLEAAAFAETAIRTALAGGDIVAAQRLAQVAAGAVRDGSLLEHLIAEVEAAMRAGAPVLQADADILAATLDQYGYRLTSRTLVVVGGHANASSLQQAADDLGVDGLEIHETSVNSHVPVDTIVSRSPDDTLVVVMTARIGHSESGPIAEGCKGRGIPHLEVHGGVSSLRRAVIEWAEATA